MRRSHRWNSSLHSGCLGQSQRRMTAKRRTCNFCRFFAVRAISNSVEVETFSRMIYGQRALYAAVCTVFKYLHAHQCIHIEALPAHEQQQAVNASVKRFRAGKARQQLVAKDREAVLVVVHHADQQLGAYTCLRCTVGDAVDRCLWLQHHLAVHEVLHAQMDTQPRICGLQIAPRFDAAGTDGQVIGRITVLQQVQVSQLGIRQQQ